MTQDVIKYPLLIDQAMRHMVRDMLKRVSVTGLPADHHFYISLDTNYPGVVISEQLKTRYPKEITIVLQHQFWDFKIDDNSFQVTLSFGGVPEKLVIPFAAMTAFADPSVKFGLQFQTSEALGEPLPKEDMPVEIALPTVELKDAAGAEIISLESFRKK